MRDLLQQLIKRQHASIDGELTDSDELNAGRQNLTSLVLAEAALARAGSESHDQPMQIVVIGPTQVGKSSVANMLIGQNLADASPIAGHTIHCQGFYLTDKDESTVDTGWLRGFFDGRSPSAQQALDRDLLSEYSLTFVPASGQLKDMVVWDTPDFDSVDSLSYSVPVLRAIALADLVVLVVSKEKYADKSVWNLLRLLHDLNASVLPVMNKTPPPIRTELAESFRSKYARIADNDDAELRFIDDYGDCVNEAFTNDEISQLQLEIAHLADRRQAAELSDSAHDFIKLHWHDWTASVTAEHQLRAVWRADVDEACDEVIGLYQSEYLQHDRYKETFQLALAELLTLLEVPGIAEPITKIRSIVTWPVRRLKEAAESRQSAGDTRDDRSEERRLLEELGEHALTRLISQCTQRGSEDPYWQLLADNLSTQRSDLIGGYHRGLDSYQIMLQGEVERAARSLYKKLQEQPATLNRLRAARVTADAAAIVLAVKSGGLGAVDLVLAPAMLSLTTMLTEGALGKYMESVQNDLRNYQQREMTALINKKLRQRLKVLATDADRGNEHYISEKALSENAAALGV